MSSTSGQAPSPMSGLGALAEEGLRDRPNWSRDQRRSTARTVARLVEQIPSRDFHVIGLSGAPASGKSTIATLIVKLLNQSQEQAVRLSLDDYYLGRNDRQKLARQQHALLAQRGVPGTHDWNRLIGDLDQIRSGEVGDLRLPRFSKARDDRVPESRVGFLDNQPRIVVLEGWLIGSPPQETPALTEPVNEFESRQDPDGQWRTLVNELLAQYHRDLARRLDYCWFLAVPDWSSVVDWRWQQEREDNTEGQHRLLENRQAVSRFLAPFQRIALHMLSGCERWADQIIDMNNHHIMSLR